MKITMIGAGNAGMHLGTAFAKAGHEIIQVFSRTLEHAQLLADETGAQAINTFDALFPEADLCVIAVKDDAVFQVAGAVSNKLPDTILTHTAGSIGIDVFGTHRQCGVIWPVQSLTRSHTVQMDIPFAIHGNNPETTFNLEQLVRTISPLVYRIDDHQRAYLHLAATFANNFSNHMYALARYLTHAHDIPFEILQPIILETAEKVREMTPEEAQTGAAVRHDLTTISKHLRLLSEDEELAKLYGMLTKSIQTKRN